MRSRPSSTPSAAQLPDWRDSEGAIGADEVAAALVEAVESDRREVHIPRAVKLLGMNDVAPGLAGPAARHDPRRVGGAQALLSAVAQPSPMARRSASSLRSHSSPTDSIQREASSSGSLRSS